ncbi:MAG TPA: glycosyltransferase [Bryobacteraceae bacterium]|nr:glycosyltransferase [Bryobacteraceae bacterium]
MAERALFISPEPPYPLTGGGALRSASLLQFLAARYPVDIVLFHVDGASDPVEALPRGLVGDILSVPLPGHATGTPAVITRNSLRLLRGVPPMLDRFSGQEKIIGAWLKGRTYHTAVLEHFWCASYASLVRSHCRHLYLDLHNIESEWHARSARVESGPYSLGHKIFAAYYRRLERKLLPLFDRLIVTSSREAARVASCPTTVYPNAIPFTPRPCGPPRYSLVFSGNLDYLPNQQAVRFFHNEVWPLLHRAHPGLKWRIVGKNPRGIPPHIAADAGIEITGPVDHAISELACSLIAVVPILTGSGTRVKILEAWAAALPVVSTTLGAEGLDAVPGKHLLLADTPAEFAASISALLNGSHLRAQLADAGRALYEERYTWDAAWKSLLFEAFPPL